MLFFVAIRIVVVCCHHVVVCSKSQFICPPQYQDEGELCESDREVFSVSPPGGILFISLFNVNLMRNKV